ncbi:uncharacterized protein V6R79_003183 [Siganus canaliculatus]
MPHWLRNIPQVVHTLQASIHCRMERCSCPVDVSLSSLNVELLLKGAWATSGGSTVRKGTIFVTIHAKAASWGRKRDRKVSTKLASHSYYYIMLCRIGQHGPHPDAQHNLDYSVYHLANIIRGGHKCTVKPRAVDDLRAAQIIDTSSVCLVLKRSSATVQ